MYDVDELVRLGILQYPSSALTNPSAPVDKFDAELVELVDHMKEVCRAAPGAGLAAIQLGIRKRIFVADPSRNPQDDEFLTFINPSIKPLSKDTISFDEGCLSLPNVYLPVTRAKDIEIEFYTCSGTFTSMKVSDFSAVVLQHENDHLDGTLILDRVSRLRRETAKRKIKKAGLAQRKGSRW